MNVHFVQHETFEAPGAYLKWAEDKKHNITFSKVYAQQSLPVSVESIDLLIVMGGPQSPSTTTAECAHFDAGAEKELIKKCIDAGKAVVGVCLGSQLIGEALDAEHDHSPEKEIGNFPIQLTEEGMKDENVNHLGSSFTVGHWHNDMPGLTAGCKILAVSKGCPRQIIKYSDKVYGFQCHMELTKEVAALLIANEPDFEAESRKYKFVQTPAELLNYDYTEMNEKLYQFLDKLTKSIVNDHRFSAVRR